jgi:hypothetical protein
MIDDDGDRSDKETARIQRQSDAIPISQHIATSRQHLLANCLKFRKMIADTQIENLRDLGLRHAQRDLLKLRKWRDEHRA